MVSTRGQQRDFGPLYNPKIRAPLVLARLSAAYSTYSFFNGLLFSLYTFYLKKKIQVLNFVLWSITKIEKSFSILKGVSSFCIISSEPSFTNHSLRGVVFFLFLFFSLYLFFSSFSLFISVKIGRPSGPPWAPGPYTLYRVYRPLQAPACRFSFQIPISACFNSFLNMS